MKRILLNVLIISVVFICKSQTVSDIDGNQYNIVTIGTQFWLKENLKTTKLNDGTSIPFVTDFASWVNLTTPAYCNYNNTNNSDTINTFGRLYNWYTVNTNKLCPAGWHVPTNDEWTTLIGYSGGESVSGGNLKETGTAHWTPPNTGATDEFGFSALPGGGYVVGPICPIGDCGSWWSATENFPGNAISVNMKYDAGSIGKAGAYEVNGFSVRCVNINSGMNTGSVLNDDLSFYPNPARDKIYIRSDNCSKVFFSIIDITGKPVISNAVYSDAIDISNLPQGIYFIKLTDDGHSNMRRLIKE